jgi:iron complex outermembrane receptor protein
MKQHNLNPSRRMVLLLSVAIAAIATEARAQVATPSSETGQGAVVEEVLVTAQKRSERLQDVPLAVTALSGETLERQQINDTSSLVAAAPSLTFQRGSNPTNTSFRIRGIGTSLFGQGVESSVSVVLDGVVAPRQSQSFTDLADIERVEVLRGPQGTLFGKNATAGVINVVTARPSWDFGGKANLVVAQGDEYRAAATVTGPFNDQFAGRLTAFYNSVDGTVKNLAGGDKENGSESWGVRGKLEWRPTDTLDILATAEYRKDDANCCVGVLIAATTPALVGLSAPVVASAKNRGAADEGLTYANSEQQTYSVQADWDLGWGAVTSLTAYQKFSLDANYEADRIVNPAPVYVGATGGNNYAQFNLNRGLTDLNQFSQEVRLASPAGKALTYVVGAYYSELSLDRGFQRRAAYCAPGTPVQLGTPCTPTARLSLSSLSHLKTTHLAAFGQAEYEVIDHLKLIGGLRIQRERVSASGQRLGPMSPGDVPFGSPASTLAGVSASDSVVTGKAGAQYEFSRNAQIYATYTRGYKGLGFDTEISADFANQKPVLPETVNAYEIGFKGQTPDRRLGLAAAIFLADYANLQVQANRSDSTTGLISFVQTNAGSSRTEGVELEATLRPTGNFTLNAAVTYAKARISIDGLNCPLEFQAGAPIVAVGAPAPINVCYRQQTLNPLGATVTSAPLQNIRDGGLPASPEWRINLAPRYTFDVSDNWAGELAADISYQSSQQYALEQDPLLVQKAYTLVNASVSFSRTDDRYRLTLFVKNLFDQNYYTSIGHNILLSSPTTATDILGYLAKDTDRYWGATFGLRF